MSRRTAAILALVTVTLLAPATAQADPIDIQVVSVYYKAAIAFGNAYDLTSAPSSTPVREQWIGPGTVYGVPVASAAATADWLTVVTSSYSAINGGGSGSVLGAASRAEFELTFSPVTDGVGSIGLQFPACGTAYEYCGGFGPYTQGFADLFDVTSGQDMWKYSVARNGSSFISYGGAGIQPFVLPQLLPTAFIAGHVYDLHLLVDGDSFGDRTGNGIQVTGVSVPDQPSSLLLLAFGLVTLGTFRRVFRRAKYQ
jgi:hypothetical protein